jgi:hypothetical protein
MLELKNDITIGDYTFNFVNNLEIVSTWDLLTDTATMNFPKKLRYKKGDQVVKNIVSGDNPLFKRGDSAAFVVGYNDQTAERFRGYVSGVSPRNSLIFEFEDDMYLLKQTTIKNYVKNNITLDTFLTDIIGDIVPWETTVDFSFSIRIPRATIAEILDFIRKNYGIISYFREGKLYSGVAYQFKNSSAEGIKIHEIQMDGENGVVIEDDTLIYERDDDQKIKVRAVSIYSDNTKKEWVEGDTDGGERTQYFYNVSEADLKTFAKEAIEKFKYTGWRGRFTTFANPRIRHGDAVRLKSEKIPDADGLYLVKSVTTKSGIDGGRQTIELDIKIN